MGEVVVVKVVEVGAVVVGVGAVVGGVEVVGVVGVVDHLAFVDIEVVGGKAVEGRVAEVFADIEAVEHMAPVDIGAVAYMAPAGMAPVVGTADRDFHHYNLVVDIVDNWDIRDHDGDDDDCGNVGGNRNSDMDCCCNSGTDSCYNLDVDCCCCNCLSLFQMENTLIE